MRKDKRTKTFGIRTPMHLYDKLLFDIKRLDEATTSTTKGYAAFDCAVDAWHLVDWTLHHESVDDVRFKELTGRERTGPSAKKGKLTIEASFAELQSKRLPYLQYCQNLANGVKHRELRNDLMPELSSGSTSLLEWGVSKGERSVSGVRNYAYIRHGEDKIEAVEFFKDVADQWEQFLIKEGLFSFHPDHPDY